LAIIDRTFSEYFWNLSNFSYLILCETMNKSEIRVQLLPH
jgi:hypothetical protein